MDENTITRVIGIGQSIVLGEADVEIPGAGLIDFNWQMRPVGDEGFKYIARGDDRFLDANRERLNVVAVTEDMDGAAFRLVASRQGGGMPYHGPTFRLVVPRPAEDPATENGDKGLPRGEHPDDIPAWKEKQTVREVVGDGSPAPMTATELAHIREAICGAGK